MSVKTPFLDYVAQVTDNVPAVAGPIKGLRAAVQKGLVVDAAQLRMMAALAPAQIQFASLLSRSAGNTDAQVMKVALMVVGVAGIRQDDKNFKNIVFFAASLAHQLWQDSIFNEALVTEVVCAPATVDIAMSFLEVIRAAHPAWAGRIERVRLINTGAIGGTEQEQADAKLLETYKQRYNAIRQIVYPNIKSVTPKPSRPDKKDLSVDELVARARSEPVDYGRLAQKEQIEKQVNREIERLAPLAPEPFRPRQLANTGAESVAAPRENIVARMLGTCKERKAQLVAAQENYERVSERARDRYLELLKLRKEIEVLRSSTVRSALKKPNQAGGGFMCPDAKFDVQIERYQKLAMQVEGDIASMSEDIKAAEAELEAAQAASGNASEFVITAEVIAEQTTPDDEGTPYDDPEPAPRRVRFDFDPKQGGGSGGTVTSMGLAFVTVAMAFVASMAMA